LIFLVLACLLFGCSSDTCLLSGQALRSCCVVPPFFFSWLMLLWNWGAVGWWVVSAAAVGKHVVCWVVSSLAVGFFLGSPRCMFVQGSLFPLILNWSRESVPLFVQGSLFPLSYVQQACLAYVLVKGLCFLFPCIAGLQRLFDL
jgi:hypothetical protein